MGVIKPPWGISRRPGRSGAFAQAITCLLTTDATAWEGAPYGLRITFSTPVTGFAAGDITVTNGTIASFAGSGAVYTALVFPTITGPVTVQVGADVCDQGNQPSNVLGINAVAFALRDEFTTAAAAPMASPRACEPGPGTLVLVQTDGQFSIVGGAFTFPAQTTPNYGDQGFYTELWPRTAGRMLHYNARYGNAGNGNLAVGWISAASVGTLAAYNLGCRPNQQLALAGNYVHILPAVNDDEDVDYYIIQQTTGGLFFRKRTTDARPQLMFVTFKDASANLSASFSNYNNTGAFSYFRVRDLPAPFNVDDGLCVVDVAAPVSGTAYTSVADAISDLTVTAPAVLDGNANTRCGLYYRADADLTPAWHVYVDGQGRFRLDGIAADGSRTNYINVAGVIAGGATITLRNIYDSTKHNAYSLAGAIWTKSGGEIDASLNDDVARVIPEAPAGWTLDALQSWARRSATYDELDRL